MGPPKSIPKKPFGDLTLEVFFKIFFEKTIGALKFDGFSEKILKKSRLGSFMVLVNFLENLYSYFLKNLY